MTAALLTAGCAAHDQREEFENFPRNPGENERTCYERHINNDIKVAVL